MKTAIAFALAATVAVTPSLAQSPSAFTRADADMTREWRATNAYMKQRDGENTSRGGGFGYAAALLASQRAWLRFRDTQCAIEGGEFAGGSQQIVVVRECGTRLTRARAADLRTLRWERL